MKHALVLYKDSNGNLRHRIVKIDKTLPISAAFVAIPDAMDDEGAVVYNLETLYEEA